MAAHLGRRQPGTSRRTTVVVTARVLLLAGFAVALGAIHIPGRPRTLCTLRSMTGIPCPFCGGTTAVVELGQANLVGALAASPLAVVLVAALPLRGIKSLGRVCRQPAARWALVGAILVAAELWQLQRFGLLSA